MSRTVFQLSRSICQIIAFDKGIACHLRIVLSNLFEYRYKPYALHCQKLDSLVYISVAKEYRYSSKQFYVVGFKS